MTSFVDNCKDPVKVSYNELSYNELSYEQIYKIGCFCMQNNQVITNPGYNQQKWPVPSFLLEESLTV